MNLSHLFRSATRSLLMTLVIAAPMSVHAAGAPVSPESPADSETAAVELDPLDVTGARGAFGDVSPEVAAARLDMSFTPGGVEVIDASRYLRGRASTVEDTFALSAGVIAQSRFGSDEARLSIRGSGIQRTFHGRGLRILQDGVPLNLADGSFDMQAFEPLSAAYINVWRGGNALAYGSSTLGGAIEYVSRTGRDGVQAFSRLEAGAWDYTRASLAGGFARGAWDGFASFTRQAQDGFRDHARQRNQRLFANTGLRFSDTAETRWHLTAVRTDSELPGSLTKQQAHADPRAAAGGNIALNQKRDFDLLRVSNRTTLRTGQAIWELTAAWSYKDLDHPIFQVIDQLSNDALLGATLTHTGEIAGRASRLRAGVLLNRGVTHAANFVNAAGARGALVSAADQTATNVEAFFEEQLALGRGLTLVLGASAASNRRENERLTGGAPSYVLEYDRVMPKAGVRWDARDVQVYANISGSYEPPSFSETLTLNTAREAQTATTFELGARGARGAWSWDASIYHANIDRELLTIDHDNNPATPAATINADQTTHSGVELATEVDLLGAWRSATARAAAGNETRVTARLAWTYGRCRFDDDARYGDNVIAGLPPHVVRGELTWERGDWYAGPTIEWVPQKTFIDHRNTFAADPYAIVGARVGQRRARGLSWFVEGRNLTDKRYVATTGVIENAQGLDQVQFLPGDGRSWFAGAEVRW